MDGKGDPSLPVDCRRANNDYFRPTRAVTALSRSIRLYLSRRPVPPRGMYDVLLDVPTARHPPGEVAAGGSLLSLALAAHYSRVRDFFPSTLVVGECLAAGSTSMPRGRRADMKRVDGDVESPRPGVGARLSSFPCGNADPTRGRG